MLGKARSYFKCVRFEEVLLLLGIPFLGIVSQPFTLTPVTGSQTILLLFSFVLIASHIYTFNDWSDLLNDKFNEYRTPLNTAQVSSRGLLVFSFVLLIAGLGCSIALSFSVFLAGSIIAACSFLYSSKRIFLKGMVFASSFIHLLAGTMYYLFGYLLFNRCDRAGVFTGLYFGILYVAGHLNHEIMDIKGDSLAGFTTNAIKFGPEKMLRVCFGIMAVSNIYLLILCVYGILPIEMFLMPLAVFPAHLYLFSLIAKNDASFGNIIGFRNSYRKLYASMGIVWSALSIMRFPGI
jgi:4-hydroxybenzoate polyprenyltransferase